MKNGQVPFSTRMKLSTNTLPPRCRSWYKNEYAGIVNARLIKARSGFRVSEPGLTVTVCGADR